MSALALAYTHTTVFLWQIQSIFNKLRGGFYTGKNIRDVQVLYIHMKLTYLLHGYI